MKAQTRYEQICISNRYLYAEMEYCTLMINFLESKGADASEVKLKRSRIKSLVDINLDKLEFLLDMKR